MVWEREESGELRARDDGWEREREREREIERETVFINFWANNISWINREINTLQNINPHKIVEFWYFPSFSPAS